MQFYTNVKLYNGQIYHRGYKNEKRNNFKQPCKPYLFLKSKNEKSSVYKSIYGDSLDKIEFPSVKEARDFLNRYKDVDNFPIFGLQNWLYPWINDFYKKEVLPKTSLIKKAFIDIEVHSTEGFPEASSANYPITAISVYVDGIFYLYAYKEPLSFEDTSIKYIYCKNEPDLLRRFLQDWQEFDVDVISGWNIDQFDIPYIVNRTRKILGENIYLLLSPWKIVQKRNITSKYGKDQEIYDIYGISSLDYLQLYKKFTYSEQESYRLDYIAQVELDENKVDYGEYSSLAELYDNNFKKFCEYNIHDVRLVERLDAKMGFLDLVFAISFDAKCNFEDALTTVRLWDVIIHNYLFEKNIIVPPYQGKRDDDRQIVGAYVKEPKPGLYSWVTSFDLTSLYPSIIMQYNVSPEKYRGMADFSPSIEEMTSSNYSNEFLKNNNVSLTANRCLWDKRERGIFPELVKKMFVDRQKYKKKMIELEKEYQTTKNEKLANEISRYNNMQLVRKILLNSLYGAIGNPSFRYFKEDFAEAITSTGQLTIKWAEFHINEYLKKIHKDSKDRIIAVDTDSLYLDFGDLIKKSNIESASPEKIVKFIDAFSRQSVEPFFEKIFLSLFEKINGLENCMKMKREAIADKGIFIAKKRYILNVYDNEGVFFAEPKLKMMGIEAVRSSTPKICRSGIKDTLKIIMNYGERETQDFIKSFREKHVNSPFEDISFPRGCNNIAKYSDRSLIYKSATPIHVKGSLLYNYYLKEKKLKNKYPEIKEGDKIKFSYLKMPNPFRDTVVSVPAELPKEFNLTEYIDYDKMFNKSFLEPIKSILECVGWNPEPVSNLDKFFS